MNTKREEEITPTRGFKGMWKDEKGFYCQPLHDKFYFETGKVYEIDTPIKMCCNGFHFCKDIKNVLMYHPILKWTAVAEIEVIGKIIEKDNKCVTSKIKIIRMLSYEELHNKLIESLDESILANNSRAVNNSYGVNNSNGISMSDGVKYSCGIVNSNDVSNSRGVNDSYSVNDSISVYDSKGVIHSNGVINSYGIINCNGISGHFFAANMPVKKFLFQKEVSEKRYYKVVNKFKKISNNFIPEFTNIHSLYLKNNSDWKSTPIQAMEEISKKEAWRNLPQEAIDYLKSLPEFDANIFYEVTGINVNE
jgi:hypothetical protein